MTADLTSAERVTVDRFDAAVPAPESLRERVAEAIAASDGCSRANWPGIYEARADAAIAVITGGAK